MPKLTRYIPVLAGQPIVAITGQTLVDKDNEPIQASTTWFLGKLLLDGRFGGDFEKQAMAVEIMQAARTAQLEGAPCFAIPDAPHWALLAEVARNPKDRAAYDALLAETNVRFARSILEAPTTDPRIAVAPLPQAAE